jgi:hypothetical protein
MDAVRMTKLVAVAVVCALALIACSDSKTNNAEQPASSNQPSASSQSAAPTTFGPAVCAAILHWQDRMVDAANAFSTDSPKLDVPGRRARYSRAFEDQKEITNQLRRDLETAPAAGAANAEPIRAVLVAATDDVQTTLRLNQADAAAHPDSDYEFQAVKEDRLFSGTEKSLSQILKPLDEQARLYGVTELSGTCGRR